MSIHKIDRTLDSRQDGVIIHEEAEAESQGIVGDEEHKQRPVERAVESDEEGADEAETEETESDETEEEDQGPAATPPSSANAAGAKKVFGTMRRPNSTVKKGNDAYNYEEKYPEDAIYEETAPECEGLENLQR